MLGSGKWGTATSRQVSRRLVFVCARVLAAAASMAGDEGIPEEAVAQVIGLVPPNQLDAPTEPVCWGKSLGCKKPCTEYPVPGEKRDSGKQYQFCKSCRGDLFVPVDRARAVPIKNKDTYKKRGPGLWKSDTERYRLFNYHPECWHKEEAIVVWETAPMDILRHGSEIPREWCTDVDGTLCLWLKWSTKDFQPVHFQPTKPSSRKRKSRQAERGEDEAGEEEEEAEEDREDEGDEDDEDEEGDPVGEEDERSRRAAQEEVAVAAPGASAASVERTGAAQSTTGSASRTRPTSRRAIEARALEENLQKQEALLKKLVEDFKKAGEDTEDEVLLAFNDIQIETAQKGLKRIKDIREKARRAASAGGEEHEAESPNWRSLSGEPEATPRFRSLGAEEYGKREVWCKEHPKEWGEFVSSFEGRNLLGGEIAPHLLEEMWMELVESLNAHSEARAVPQLQQLHEEYRAIIGAA